MFSFFSLFDPPPAPFSIQCDPKSWNSHVFALLWYFDVTEKHFKKAIENKRIFLFALHVCPYTRNQAVMELERFFCKIVNHPPCRLNLALGDYFIIPHLKLWLASHKFVVDGKLKMTLLTSLNIPDSRICCGGSNLTFKWII